MKIKDLKWSKHARFDREPRMVAILMTVGFGEIYEVQPDRHDPKRLRAFTTTGCIIIIQGEWIITGYVAGFDQMTGFFGGKVPPEIRKAVKKTRNLVAKYEGGL